MKVLIADKFDSTGLDALAALECEVVSQPALTADQLPGALTEHSPDILIVRSTKVRSEAIAAAGRVKLIVRAGAGYDTIDVAAASREGIFVANCPGKNAVAVAELTWALILSCDRRVPEQTHDLRAGTWDKKKYSKARGLYGRTLGVLGLGTIGREVVTRARAFGMPILAWSRSLTAARATELGVVRADTPEDVARGSDIVTVHVASTAATKHLIGPSFVDAMRPGAFLINTSRGAVLDEAAVLAGIESKGLRVGLDVYDNEPGGGRGSFDSTLAKSAGLYGTHHIGASTDQAQQAIAAEAVRVIKNFCDTGRVDNCVNLAGRSSATCMLTVRHRNRPGVLAQVFQVLSEAGINVEEMDNVLYEGVHAACARIQLREAPTDTHLERIRTSCEHILSMELSDI